jgi:hypothetical protein
METPRLSPAFDRLLDQVVECFTPGVAQQIAELRADPQLQARLDELATKANRGILTQAEAQEYDRYIEAIDLIGVLQAKAQAMTQGHR